MSEENEKLTEEEFFAKQKALTNEIQLLEESARTGIVLTEIQEFRLTEARKELFELEDTTGKEVKRIIADAVEAGEGSDFGIEKK